ncbi:tRNA-binding protein [Hazenella sp. IB182357]|uniref:tRNA-binding protein n=1 Tax=Polycladospora coralii TaxID=2771432 RepID=A0A926RWE3_9BACL|nr:tRNA-binding protein [Polycladospora coralii]MBD1371416.1 tRNA-binding protein [Polycladospora coralii]
MEKECTYEDFLKVDMRVGEIERALPFPKARKPAYQLWINFGEEIGIKKSSAQVTERYQVEDLIGRKVIAVVNFPEKQIANFMSEALVLGIDSVAGGVSLLQIEYDTPLGTRVY